MPLSDRERQILSDIEARLREDDPRFARTVATTTVSSQTRRHFKLAVITFGVGFLLLFGIVAHIGWGIAGFVLMLAGAVHGGNMLRRLGQSGQPGAPSRVRGGFQRYLDDRRDRGDSAGR